MSLPQNPFASSTIPSMKKSPSSSSLEKRDNLNVDRISNLTDDVLLKILNSMPTEKAVQTSLLSKRWEGVWKKMSCLFFDMRNNLKVGVPLYEQSNSIAQLITKVLSFFLYFYSLICTITNNKDISYEIRHIDILQKKYWYFEK